MMVCLLRAIGAIARSASCAVYTKESHEYDLLAGAALDDESLLRNSYARKKPGNQKVRAEIRSLASNRAARGALIVGPVGAVAVHTVMRRRHSLYAL